ncbi:MAG: hypothetical protein B0D91_10570 [Oceanospirillales bacterium LUC14_002_19_P2]|nr:MAG: hypothetical protein B0D91_10570 [Oceanospirillales bacterium LUC14_002_19_P2]
MESVSEALAVRTGQRGDPLDRAVTVRELNNIGVVRATRIGRPVPSAGASGDLQPGATLDPADNALVNEAIPNKPTSVKFTGTENYIIIDYAPPQDFVAHTEVWVSEDNDQNNAVMVGVINTRPWGYQPDDNTATYYFWLRHVSYRNKASGFTSGSGACDSNNADDLTINTLTVATATIGQGEVGNLLIGDSIQSDNYVPGVSGWIIKK